MPIEYDSHLPRWASQATNSWVPPPESVRISVRRPRQGRFGSWASVSVVASMWSAACSGDLHGPLAGRPGPGPGHLRASPDHRQARDPLAVTFTGHNRNYVTEFMLLDATPPVRGRFGHSQRKLDSLPRGGG